MFLNLGKKRKVDHFISSDGISAQWFGENFARYIGPGTEWTYCTHMENGKEGFLCKVYEPISPDILLRMRLDYHEAKQRLRNQAKRAYLERLEDTRRQGERERQQREESRRQHQARSQQQVENWPNHGDPGLDIPILRLPQFYNSSQNNLSRDDRSQSGPIWNIEGCYWVYEKDYSTNNTRYARSTDPATPVSPSPSGHWGDLPDRGMSLTPVSPLSHHGDNSGDYQQRPSSVIAYHDRLTGVQRPHSATDMRQSSTGRFY